MKKDLKSTIILLFLLLCLPIAFYLVKNVQKYFGRAALKPASIVIDSGNVGSPITPVWQALAQGGEFEADKNLPVFFDDVIPQLISLSPKYIRIDHLYDFYQAVARNSDGSLVYNWSNLDKMVDDILKTGARPFFSLSYMPSSIAQNGNIIGLPNSFSDWQNVVKETVKHYSGKSQRNLTGVYYEVWNEPDLFGNWRIGGNKDYQLLYQYAVLGAVQAENVNDFKIGGPATTNPMKVWVDDFLTFIERNNLRLDFLSWHRYSFDPQQFSRDLINVNSWLANHPNYQNTEKIISEWGSDSENNPVHDTIFDAIHTLAVVRQIADKVNFAFSFEVKDSPGPNNQQFWGRWGIFTHQQSGLVAKPRYSALKFLNQLSGDRLLLSGEGTDVTALAVKDKETIRILLVNYKNSRFGQQEAVPVKITNLTKGIYSYQEIPFLGNPTKTSFTIRNNFWEKIIYLPPYQAMIIELTKTGTLADFQPGRFDYPLNQALVLNQDNLALTFPINQNLNSGTIEFWLKNNFDGALISDQYFTDIPLSSGLTLSARKELLGFGNSLRFGLFNKGTAIEFLDSDLTSWKVGQWHFVSFSWQEEPNENLNLSLFVDGVLTQKTIAGQKIGMVSNIFVGGYQGSLDELRISNVVRNPEVYYLQPLTTDNNTLFLKKFDGSL